MPIEIKELHIKINVSENSNSGAKPASTSSAAEKDTVAECVEQVMKIIERKKNANMTTTNGELKKLKIIAYSDPQFNNPISDIEEFITLMNPEKYTFHYKIEQDTTQAAGTSSPAPRFTAIAPEELELDFVFDRTGVIAGKETTENGVIEDIEHFRKVILEYNGTEHKPNYLKIAWGSLLFKGSLTEMTIEYKLFRPDGTPIRAIAKGKFKGVVEDELRAKQQNNQSPDLTHTRIVKAGDTLPLMSFKIYGDSKYYLEVARANKLINFRKLKIGQKIFFPPLQKQQ